MKSLHKKGGMPWMMNLMIIAALFFVLWTFTAGNLFAGFSEETTKSLVEQRLEGCKAKGDKGQLDGSSYPDWDEDGLPDSCDNCPRTPNFGDDVEDKDGDNFPYLKAKSTRWQICCGNNGVGGNDPELAEDQNKYCETEENDQEYGPKKLINSYLNMFKTKKG
ncbi:MAG: hypothetical protein U9O94_03750 [Nanoarchaeota archaeon]|nr:hypothetical protein [Nanoarchaeota archaeon]